MSSGELYYHGGPPGLKPGDLILPPAETGLPSTADYGAEHVCRRDRVYLATNPVMAGIYAAMHPSRAGVVYGVEPIGELTNDPDWMGEAGESVEAERARIVACLGWPEQWPPREQWRTVATRKNYRTGRNAPCPCGSGLKFKRCHGR